MPDVIIVDQRWLQYSKTMPEAIIVNEEQFRRTVEMEGGKLIEVPYTDKGVNITRYVVEINGMRSDPLPLPTQLTWRLLTVNNDSITVAPAEIPGLLHNDSSRILATLGLYVHDVKLPFRVVILPTPDWDNQTPVNASGAKVLVENYIQRLIDIGAIDVADLNTLIWGQ